MSKRRLPVIVVVVAVGVMFTVIATQIGCYSVQPIGALPEGVTLIIWRASGEPFFNSPDAQCLTKMGGVSLLCRGIALGRAPTDRIIMRLPYWETAYLLSTNGETFGR